jgi:signal transduction histidine kinase
LTVAAQRALDASRGAIIDLSASSASSTLMAVEAVCGELERRHSVEIDVRLADEDAARSSDFDAGSREHITRITREAIVNAIKHGRAQRIEVELGSPATEQLLRVSDNGCGLIERGPGSAYGLGLGLETMRTRASSLGARMVVRRRSAGGTELLVLRT